MLAATRLTNFAIRGLMVTAVAALLTLSVALLILHAHGIRVLSVETASMIPTFRPGDALIVAPVVPKDLRLGEVITYAKPGSSGMLISHRLIGIDRAQSQLTTAGDARMVPDAPVAVQRLEGRVVAISPHFGAVLNFLRQPAVIASVLMLPAAVFLYREFDKLLRHFAKPDYRASDFTGH